MKTTARHYAIFKDECEKWLNVLGIKDWEVVYWHSDCDRKGFAWANLDIQGHCVSIGLAKNTTQQHVNEYELRLAAFHEVCHVLIAQLTALINCRSVNFDMIEQAEHTLIRRLENTMFKAMSDSLTPLRRGG